MKWIFISDVHAPYHDVKAVDAMLTSLKVEKPELIVLGGDIVDFYKISRYDKSPFNHITLQNEIDETIALLKNIKRAAPKGARIVWLEGNHMINEVELADTSTRFRFRLPRAGHATLSVYDAVGRRVRVLADGSFDAGEHLGIWDGIDASGRRARAGVYFVQLRSLGLTGAQKIVLR